MGRIRTIKPEFPQSESMGRISRESRLCFVLLWTQADDEGRLRGSSRMLASLLYPYDEDAGALMDGWLAELEGEGCVLRYQVGGSSYLQILNWRNHQKVERASASRLPAPPDSARLTEASPNPPRHSGEDSGSSPGAVADGSAKDRGAFGEDSPNPHRILTEGSATDLDLDLDLDHGPGTSPLPPDGAAPAAPEGVVVPHPAQAGKAKGRKQAPESGKLWPAGWDEGAEKHLQDVLKGYPGKRPNGTVMSNGTPKELRERWLAIMAANPGVTPRLLKNCAWALLEAMGENNAYLPLLTTMYGPKKATWEVYRQAAEQRIAEADAAAGQPQVLALAR